MRAIVPLCALLLAGCMTTPTDQATIANRRTSVYFAGYSQGSGSAITIQAYNPTSQQYEPIKTGVVSGNSAILWRGYNIYPWDAGNLLIPAAYWQLSGGQRFAQVKAVSSDGYTVNSLKPDWTVCSGNTTTAQEFQQQCVASTTPVAKVIATSADMTFYVDGNVAVSGNGTPSSPYKTIAQAITAANTYSGGRKRIEVASGYYQEHITLSPGIDLVSPRVGAAIINGGGNRGSGFVTVIGANDSSISGFVITGGYPAGVQLGYGSAHVFRNIVRGNYGYGIGCIGGCTSLIENNTVIGQLRNNGGQSVGISISSSSPTIRNNIVYRQDTGFLYNPAGGSEAYNLSYDNDFNYTGKAPGSGSLTTDPLFVRVVSDDFRLAGNSPARHAGDPSTHNADSTTADLGAFDGNGGYALSLAAQDYALEAIFSARWDVNSQLYSYGAQTTPNDPNPTFWVDPGIASHPNIGAVESEITIAVQTLTNNAATPVFVTGVPPNPCLAFSVVEGPAPMGTAYLDHWHINGNICDAGPNNFTGGRVTGGRIDVSITYLDGAPYGPFDGNHNAIVHETGHAYGGLSHVFRGFSPIAYGPRPETYGAIDQEAFTLRAADIVNYASVIPMADWFSKGYLTQAAVRPFPSVETVSALGDPPLFHVGTQVRVDGSRFSVRLESDASFSQMPNDFELPMAYFNGISAPTFKIMPKAVGGSARSLYVTAPAGATNGWLSFRVRGMESIPIRILVAP